MFQRKTVFVVGAGGSKEVGLPMGDQLKSLVGDKVAFEFPDRYNPSGGDQNIYWAIKDLTKKLGKQSSNPWWHAGQAIKAAMPQAISIDNFMHTHSDDEHLVQMGKLGIAVSILQAERSSAIYNKPHSGDILDFRVVKESWHTTFCKMLLEHVVKTDLTHLLDNVSFITFNYDRCIEHYMEQALRNYLRVTKAEAQALVNGMTIIHPYGQVGRLPWQPNGSVEFGADLHHTQLLAISDQIRTFTERVEDDEKMGRIQGLMADAAQIIYLGFSYGQLNLDLLSICDFQPAKVIIGTSYGIADPNRLAIMADVKQSLGLDPPHKLDIELPSLTCNQLLQDYWRRIVN